MRDLWSLVLGPPRRDPVAFEQWNRPARPNEFILCPAHLCPGPTHGTPPVFGVPADRLAEAWCGLVERKPRVRRLLWDPALRQGAWEIRTAVLRFPDTLTVRVLPTEAGGATLAVHSQAHYGYHDLGVNGRRARRWLKELQEEIAA